MHSIVDGQPVTQEIEMEYDADCEAPLWGNRVVSVIGVNGTNYSASFVYDGNGQRVREASTINNETRYTLGNLGTD